MRTTRNRLARLAACGLLVGGTASLLLTRTISGMLYGVTPTDPVTFGVVAAPCRCAARRRCLGGSFRARSRARRDRGRQIRRCPSRLINGIVRSGRSMKE